MNHEILEEFQKLGYPVFSQSTLPLDEDLLERLFGDEVRAGAITSPLDIQDVWKNSYSASTNHKVWAAKFTARHPNLVALELSSFKCGHDAPIYTTIESIIERSGTPYFSFKDIDENKPTGSIKIRVETIHYFLKRYIEVMNKPERNEEVERQIAEYEKKLREQLMREHEFAELAAAQREHARRSGSCRSSRTEPQVGRRDTTPAASVSDRCCHERGRTRRVSSSFNPESQTNSRFIDRRPRSLCRHFPSKFDWTVGSVPNGHRVSSLSSRVSNSPSRSFLASAVSDQRAVAGDGERHWPASKIYHALRSWECLFQSRLLPGDFHPLIAYLFTEPRNAISIVTTAIPLTIRSKE